MLDLPGLTFDHGGDIAALREAVQQFTFAEIGAGTGEIRRMLIGRELFAATE